MFRLIAAKMAALSGLLGNATDAIHWHNEFHFQKDRSMSVAFLFAMFADSLQPFFPTNSKISEVPFEHYQVWYEAIHDLTDLLRPGGDKSLR